MTTTPDDPILAAFIAHPVGGPEPERIVTNKYEGVIRSSWLNKLEGFRAAWELQQPEIDNLKIKIVNYEDCLLSERNRIIDQQETIDNLRVQLADQQARIDGLIRMLKELHALVRGECPQLLDEDSGGNGDLSIQIEDAIQGEKS